MCGSEICRLIKYCRIDFIRRGLQWSFISQFSILPVTEFSDKWLKLKCISSFHVLGIFFLLNYKQESSDSDSVSPVTVLTSHCILRVNELSLTLLKVQMDSVVSCFSQKSSNDCCKSSNAPSCIKVLLYRRLSIRESCLSDFL